MEILAVENLTFTYPVSKSPALKNISFSIVKGEFAVLCGATGCGKSTLLRMLKRELSPLGEKKGRILFDGTPAEELSAERSTTAIGFVMQKPEQQIVTDTVWHELAFGLENLNFPQQSIARRVAETAAYFGIEEWYDKKVSELSGGQKQLLSLAAVMAMNPEVLILDEPTAQLDPIAASEFVAALKKINRELGITVILSEHRLEDAVSVCDRLMVLDKGELIHFDEPRKVAEKLEREHRIFRSMPAAVRLYRSVDGKGSCPLDIREGRSFIESSFGNSVNRLPRKEYIHSEREAVRFRDVYLRYERELPDVLKGLDFTVYEKEIYCILGGNGSGKSTTLSAAANLVKPYSGTIEILGKKLKSYKNQTLYRECLALLPQDVQTVFLRNTVREELEGAEKEAELLPLDFSSLAGMHPYDLSGGEQQLTALARVLAAKPKILLLDEPTKGIDADSVHRLIGVLKKLKSTGMTIIAVTHDMEFAGECADRCALLFRGEIVSEDVPSAFFSENNFYTTSASRMTRGFYSGVATIEEAAELCRMNG